jgi:1,4-dihydroxy-6-naphthoate synthase
MTLRIGISPCPNDVFIYAGLILRQVAWEGEEYAFDFQELETLNQAARRGEYDAVKISFANFPACAEGYRLLHCGGALGRGCGPLLLTGGAPFDPQREIFVPGEATTAHALLQAYAAANWPGRPLRKRFLTFDAIYRALLEDSEAQGVVIHEMRFTYARDGLSLARDLGAFWEAQTGAPIPLGALVARRHSTVTGAAWEAAVRASLAWAYANEAQALELCRRYSQSMDEPVLRSHIDLYVNGYSRDLGTEGEAAVALFFRHIGYNGQPF